MPWIKIIFSTCIMGQPHENSFEILTHRDPKAMTFCEILGLPRLKFYQNLIS